MSEIWPRAQTNIKTYFWEFMAECNIESERRFDVWTPTPPFTPIGLAPTLKQKAKDGILNTKKMTTKTTKIKDKKEEEKLCKY